MLTYIMYFFQSYEGGPPMLLKEEPDDDRPRNFQKVPSLSDLSDPEASLGEYRYYFSSLSILISQQLNG